jgi:hypothetical protein
MFSVEMIWSQVKQRVQVRNNTFKMKNVLALTNQSISEVTADDWSKCVRHVVDEENMYAILDGIQNLPLINIQPVIIDLNESESDDEWEELEEVEVEVDLEVDLEVEVEVEVDSQRENVLDYLEVLVEDEEVMQEEAVEQAVEGAVEEVEDKEQEEGVEEEAELEEMEVLVEQEFDNKPFRHLSENSYQCLLCYKNVVRFSALLKHLRSHKQCSKCGKCFAGRFGAKSCKRHEQKCKGLKRDDLKCDFCLKKVRFKSKLKDHKKTCLKRPL